MVSWENTAGKTELDREHIAVKQSQQGSFVAPAFPLSGK